MLTIPYMLGYSSEPLYACIPTGPRKMVPGDGAAGWTVSELKSDEAARTFLRALPRCAWMGATFVIAERLGVT